MAQLDEVLERMVNEPAFRQALEADRDRALAAYDLTAKEREVLDSTVSTSTGRAGAVEGRQSKSALMGVLSELTGIADVARGGPSAPPPVDVEQVHDFAEQFGGGSSGGGGGGAEVPPVDWPDTDGDGIDDPFESQHGTDPLDPDTDGDGYTDGEEVKAGTDPTSARSFPDGSGRAAAADGPPAAEETGIILQTPGGQPGDAGEETGYGFIGGNPGDTGEETGFIIVNGQPSDTGEDTGFIIVGGQPSDDAEETGIVIVDGQPSDDAEQTGIILHGRPGDDAEETGIIINGQPGEVEEQVGSHVEEGPAR